MAATILASPLYTFDKDKGTVLTEGDKFYLDGRGWMSVDNYNSTLDGQLTGDLIGNLAKTLDDHFNAVVPQITNNGTDNNTIASASNNTTDNTAGMDPVTPTVVDPIVMTSVSTQTSTPTRTNFNDDDMEAWIRNKNGLNWNVGTTPTSYKKMSMSKKKRITTCK